MTVARFPLRRGLVLQSQGLASSDTNQREAFSVLQNRVVKGDGVRLVSCSWRDVVLGKPRLRRERIHFTDEDCLLSAPRIFYERSERHPEAVMFPGILCVGRCVEAG